MIALSVIYAVAILASLFFSPLLSYLLVMFFGPFALILAGIVEIRGNNY